MAPSIASLFFAVSLALLVVAATALPAGVHPENSSQYETGVPFSCDGGKVTLPWANVNDDYCDCADGSDEPGTAACANGNFYCANAGFSPTTLPSSRVSDGVCDCCDGSDEAENSRVTCPNTCATEGAAARETLLVQIAQVEKALLMVEEHALASKMHGTETEQKKTALEAESAALALEIVDAETVHTSAEAAYEKYEEELNAALNEQFPEPEGSDEEVEHGEEGEEVAPGEETGGDDEGADDQEEVSELEALRKTREEAISSARDADSKLQTLKQAKEEALKALSTLRSTKSSKEDEISKLQSDLDLNLGEGNRFLPISKEKVSYEHGGYTYTLTVFDSVKQGRTNMGKWANWDEEKPDVMHYTNGQKCWGGPNRSCDVTVACGYDGDALGTISNIKEPSKCFYTLLLKTPFACTPEYLQQLKDSLPKPV